MRASIVGGLTVLAGWLVFPVASASAQVLIWSLPKEDGAWVRFEGNYKQVRSRPNSNAGDEVLEWRSELTISAVGSEPGEIEVLGKNGVRTKKEVPCRWVEFKSLTKPGGLDAQPGPGDTFVYKVLIPAEKVIGQPVDADKIPVTYLPIVKGWRKVGKRDAEPTTEKALAVYPTVSLVTFYPDLKPEGNESEQIQIGGESATARLFKGSRVLQQPNSRSTNTATLWRSDDVPFGLARFQVTLTQEQKQIGATSDEFRRASLTEVDLAVVATGNDARSELGGEGN